MPVTGGSAPPRDNTGGTESRGEPARTACLTRGFCCCHFESFLLEGLLEHEFNAFSMPLLSRVVHYCLAFLWVQRQGNASSVRLCAKFESVIRTLFLASVSASARTKTSTTSFIPLYDALCSGVFPFCTNPSRLSPEPQSEGCVLGAYHIAGIHNRSRRYQCTDNPRVALRGCCVQCRRLPLETTGLRHRQGQNRDKGTYLVGPERICSLPKQFHHIGNIAPCRCRVKVRHVVCGG